MNILPALSDNFWTPLSTNGQGKTFPWPVFAANASRCYEDEPDHRKFAKFVIGHANEALGAETMQTSIWCGFGGRRVLISATHGIQRRRTWPHLLLSLSQQETQIH